MKRPVLSLAVGKSVGFCTNGPEVIGLRRRSPDAGDQRGHPGHEEVKGRAVGQQVVLLDAEAVLGKHTDPLLGHGVEGNGRRGGWVEPQIAARSSGQERWTWEPGFKKMSMFPGLLHEGGHAGLVRNC